MTTFLNAVAVVAAVVAAVTIVVFLFSRND